MTNSDFLHLLSFYAERNVNTEYMMKYTMLPKYLHLIHTNVNVVSE